MRPGYCAKHPNVPSASGSKFKCITCLSDEQQIKLSGKSCTVHPDRKVAEDAGGQTLCRECWDKARVSKIEREAAEREKQKAKPGRKADPEKVKAREQHAAEVAARKAAREAAKKKLAAKGDAFHNFENWPEDEYFEHLATLEGKDRSEFILNTPCYECGSGKRTHGISKHATSEVPYPELLPEDRQSVPVLVLTRAATMEALVEKAMKLSQAHPNLLRFGRIDSLPRSERTEKEMRAGRLYDPIIGSSDQVLDKTPWALWIPLDNTRERIIFSQEGWIKEEISVVTEMGKSALDIKQIPVSPIARVNPARWNEIDSMNGAEVLDLRNYPELLKSVKDRIAETLVESRGWMEALKNSVKVRNGNPIWANMSDARMMNAIRDRILGVEEKDVPKSRTLTVRHFSQADFAPTQKGTLSFRASEDTVRYSKVVSVRN